jgi:hypothetical protein
VLAMFSDFSKNDKSASTISSRESTSFPVDIFPIKKNMIIIPKFQKKPTRNFKFTFQDIFYIKILIIYNAIF